MSVDRRILAQLPIPLEPQHIICVGHVGSISHGTHTPSSDPNSIDDVDLMGIAIPPVEYIIGLHNWDHWVTQIDELDVTFYSLQKFIRLLLKSNPNVMGMLWMNDYVMDTPDWRSLVRIRDAFTSKKAYHSFAGYANAQLTKLESGAYKGYMGERRRALVRQFGYDPKNAAHLIRLLRMCIEFLAEGTLYVDRTDIDAEELKAIKSGAWTLNQVQSRAQDLFAAARVEYEHCILPDEPDFNQVEEWLVNTLLRRM